MDTRGLVAAATRLVRPLDEAARLVALRGWNGGRTWELVFAGPGATFDILCDADGRISDPLVIDGPWIVPEAAAVKEVALEAAFARGIDPDRLDEVVITCTERGLVCLFRTADGERELELACDFSSHSGGCPVYSSVYAPRREA